MIKKLLLTMGTLGLLASCAKEEFVANKAINKSEINAVTAYENRICAQYSYIRSQLDVLILWDNSTSGFAISAASKNALKNLFSEVASERYDFNLMVSPLVGNSPSWVLTTKNSTLSSNASMNVYKGEDQVTSFINTFNIPTSHEGGSEQGAMRATQLINSNPSIFRKNSYTYVVVLSNGDDVGCSLSKNYTCAGQEITNYNETLAKKFLCLRGNYSDYSSLGCNAPNIAITNKLDAKSFRFISVTAGQYAYRAENEIKYASCSPGSNGSVYRYISKHMLSTPYQNDPPTSYAPAVDGDDHYGICEAKFPFFSALTEEIKSTIDYHKYAYWPVASANQSIDLSSLIVKSTFELQQVEPTSTQPGYSLYNLNAAEDDLMPIQENTRFYPSLGEPFYGKMIKLHGSAQTLAGNCISVYFTEKKTRYGYIYLPAGKPNESTISVVYRYKNNGNWITIPKSNQDGWNYIEVPSLIDQEINTNLAIVNRPSNNNIKGHLIKLNGIYQFENTGAIEFKVDYIPASSN